MYVLSTCTTNELIEPNNIGTTYVVRSITHCSLSRGIPHILNLLVQHPEEVDLARWDLPVNNIDKVDLNERSISVCVCVCDWINSRVHLYRALAGGELVKEAPPVEVGLLLLLLVSVVRSSIVVLVWKVKVRLLYHAVERNVLSPDFAKCFLGNKISFSL